VNGIETLNCVTRKLWLVSAIILLALAPLGPTRGAEPPKDLPRGSILAFFPDPKSGDYSDLPSLKRWLGAQGWAICDGSEGTPDLNYRMLLGTIHPEEAGQNLGSRTHDHKSRGETGAAYGRDHAFLTGRGHIIRVPEGGHRHRLDGRTESSEHLPLSLRVLFIMKVR